MSEFQLISAGEMVEQIRYEASEIGTCPCLSPQAKLGIAPVFSIFVSFWKTNMNVRNDGPKVMWRLAFVALMAITGGCETFIVGTEEGYHIYHDGKMHDAYLVEVAFRAGPFSDLDAYLSLYAPQDSRMYLRRLRRGEQSWLLPINRDDNQQLAACLAALSTDALRQKPAPSPPILIGIEPLAIGYADVSIPPPSLRNHLRARGWEYRIPTSEILEVQLRTVVWAMDGHTHIRSYAQDASPTLESVLREPPWHDDLCSENCP